MQTRDSGAVPIGFHITMRLEDGRPFAMMASARRVVAGVVLTQGENRGLLAFSTADNHLHSQLATNRGSAGAFARYVESALRARLPLGARFEGARIRPLHDQQHAYNTFHYIHRQHERHELTHDPLREGTSLPDLLGLRVLSTSLASRVRISLPRAGRADVAKALPPSLLAAIEDGSAVVDVRVLPDAAAAAFGLSDLRGRSDILARARHAAVHVAPREAPSDLLGELLDISARAVRKLRALPPDPLAVRAVRGQALLRMALPQVTAERNASL